MCTMHLRLSGSDDSTTGLLNALRGSPGVDRVEELGADVARGRDDSSSAGLPDDTQANVRDVEIHAESRATAQAVRGRVEIAASTQGVVIEWLEPF